jgi:hypothetical protein
MKFYRFLMSLLFATLMVPLTASAGYDADDQSMTVTGVVKDINGSPMSNVVIRLNDYYVSTTTGYDGTFSLTVNPTEIGTTTNTQVDTAALKITANFDGYYPQTKRLEYLPGTTANHVFELKVLSNEVSATNTSTTTLSTTSTSTTQSVWTEPSDADTGAPVGTVVEPSAY